MHWHALQQWTLVNHKAGQAPSHTVAGAPAVSASAAGPVLPLPAAPGLSSVFLVSVFLVAVAARSYCSGGQPNSCSSRCATAGNARPLLRCRDIGPAAAG